MLSAVILTKNEEKDIQKVVKMLAFCDEIVVIDNGSTDATASLAEKAGATVYETCSDDFSERRNLGMSKAKGDWVLFIDADEVVSDALAQEILRAIESGHAEAYYLRREDIFWGKAVHYGEVKEAYQKGILRLMKKGSGMWKGAVHEVFELAISAGDGATSRLHTPLQHLSHAGIEDFLEDVNHYSTLRAKELYDSGESAGFVDILVRPFAKFIYTYWLLQGFRDGAAGFVYSFMMSFHALLTRSKVYLLKAKAKG